MPDAFQTQPNILLIQADQLSAFALSAYRDGQAITPEITRLADQGVVFQNMYCNSPLCAPSRCSMMTGQLPSHIGAYDNGSELPASLPTFAHYLRALGYRTCLSGKMHFCGPDQLHGFEDRLTSDIYPSDFQWGADWDAAGHGDVTDTRGVTKSGLCEDSVQIRYDKAVTREAEAYLRQHATADDTRPLLMTVSYTHPHDPFVCTKDFWGLYAETPPNLPETAALAPEDMDPHSRKILSQNGLLGAGFSDAQILRARRGYYGAISFFDAQIAQLCRVLEEVGMSEHTVILITSDHGEMLGERGMWFKKCFFDPAMRVPLIAHFPAGFGPQRVAEPVSLVDLLPTLVSLANGGRAPDLVEDLDGRSLLPLMQDMGSSPSRPVCAEILSEGVAAPAVMILQEGMKYIHSPEYPPLLFDLTNDPQERVNLAGRPDYAALEQGLRGFVDENWDLTALEHDIRRDQKRRKLVQAAFAQGRYAPWDHDAGGAEQKHWFRGATGYNDWAFDFAVPEEG